VAPLPDRAERTLAAQVIDIGYKRLAQRLHPDVGGSHEAMTRLVTARGRLLRAVGPPGKARRTRRTPPRPPGVVPVLGTEDAIRSHLAAAADAQLEHDRQVGRLLCEARPQVSSGEWPGWLRCKFDMGVREADRLIALAQAAEAGA
jgi:hypothetical protein